MPRKLKKKGIPPEGLTFTKSEYTLLREHYLRREYKVVECMLHHLIDITDSEYWRLRYPLFSLLKAIARKLLLNQYECVVFTNFLLLNKWRVDSPTIQKYRFDFPEVIYVNDPTDEPELRSLTLFLYLTGYSVKELLNEQAAIFLQEMVKMHPNFIAVNMEWISGQETAELELDPARLNSLYKRLSRPYQKLDYNQLVDEILHISPCYGIDKEKPAALLPVVPEAPLVKEEPEQTHIETLFPSHSHDLLEGLGWLQASHQKDLL